MNNLSQFDVAISGGGMAGATLALALDQVGLTVALVDAIAPSQQVTDEFDGRASAISFTAMRQWRTLDLARELTAAAQAIRRIVVTDGPATGASASRRPQPRLDISEADIGAEDPEEPLGWMVENRRIRIALQAGLARSSVTVFAPATATNVKLGADLPELQIGDGRRIRARLVVGAEGRRSVVREAAGIGVTGWGYDQTGVVCTIALTRPHAGVAWQHFMPGGPLAILPLTEDRASLVWTERTARANALLTMPIAAFEALLARRFGDALGRPKLLGERFAYPLSFQSAENVVGNRIVLIGDAAHGVHPIAGQGLNLGLKDVAALAEILRDAIELGEDIGGPVVLERYARWRRLDVVAGSAAADIFARTFSSDDNVLRGLRGMGMSLINVASPIRRLLAREAGGASGDLPPLLQPW